MIHLLYGAGNRDEEEYPNAEEIDLTRPSPGRHVTFGQGPRSCPGAELSRLEQNIATNVILDRLDDLRLAPGERGVEISRKGTRRPEHYAWLGVVRTETGQRIGYLSCADRSCFFAQTDVHGR